MPELPDVTVYVEHLERRILDSRLEAVRLKSPFLLRSVEPPLDRAANKRIQSVERLGKRIVLGLEEDLFLVLHLMIAGRLQWSDAKSAKIPGRIGLAAFDFTSGTLLLTEASSKKRASLFVVRGRIGLAAHDRGGLEVLTASLDDFKGALTRENHTLKRALTDPRLFSGIGNAYSDEILHHARLSPLKQAQKLDEEEVRRLYASTQHTLAQWTERLRVEAGDAFPKNVTAFREGMAAHGRYRQPCPDCGAPIQRIVYAENETNYCAKCQNEGRLLKDRSLSRLLKSDWPKTVDELEK